MTDEASLSTATYPLPKDALGRVFIDTDEVCRIFRALDELMEEPATATNGKGVAILGPARCGKSSVIKEYILRCAERDVADRPGEGVVRRPLKVLSLSLQPGTRLNSIASQVLQALNHPAPFHGGQDARTIRVIQEIKRGGYDLLVIDEIHHLVSSDTRRVRENGSHWLTHVLDATRCPMVLVGYSAFRGILSENGFLGGRLVPVSPLRAYVLDDPESFGMFRVILEEFEDALGLTEPSGLSVPDTARRILTLCNGRIGLLENFLTHARMVARRRKHNCLRREVLREAAEGVRQTWCALLFNPFEVPDLDDAIRRNGRDFVVVGDGPAGRRSK